MIEIKLGHLRNPTFIKTCQKIMNTTGLTPKVAYHAMRVCTLLDQEIKQADVAFDKLKKEWVEQKEDGSIHVPNEKMEGWSKAFEEFHDVKVTIDKHKFKLADLTPAALTPADYMMLEPMIADLELVNT